ncbi:hypothetical protein OAC22_00750 [bacterium]|nr:hypothetical protein [bacterium]
MIENRVRLKPGSLTWDLAIKEDGFLSAEKLEEGITELTLARSSETPSETNINTDWAIHFRMLYEGISALQLMLLADSAQTPEGVSRVKLEIGRQASMKQKELSKTVGIDGPYQRRLAAETARMENEFIQQQMGRELKGEER